MDSLLIGNVMILKIKKKKKSKKILEKGEI